MVITYPVGLNRVELTRGTTTLLSSHDASANAPAVTVTYPNAAGLTLNGAQTIQWTGSDADKDVDLAFDSQSRPRLAYYVDASSYAMERCD